MIYYFAGALILFLYAFWCLFCNQKMQTRKTESLMAFAGYAIAFVFSGIFVFVPNETLRGFSDKTLEQARGAMFISFAFLMPPVFNQILEWKIKYQARGSGMVVPSIKRGTPPRGAPKG